VSKIETLGIEVEQGVPLPTGRRPRSELGHLLSTLQEGDSFIVPVELRNTIYSHARFWGHRIMTQSLDGGMMRVWSLKPKTNQGDK
jgi:hypothetical protein